MMFNQKSAILKGPSREELFDSLRLGGSHHQVEFELQDKANYKVKAFVRMLEPEDGSHLRWLLKISISLDAGNATLNGYYDTVTRKGWLERF